MIRTRDLVPNIYYDKSRDFQAIGRTFEVIYNYAKTNTDLVLNSYEDVKMLDLLAKTIGFNSKHNYNTEDLYTLCNTFIWILKNKGSKKSVEMAVTAMLNAQHIDERDFLVVDAVDENKNKLYELDIYISKELTDLILLEDLFEYILPTGYAYRFIPAKFIEDLSATYTYIQQRTNVKSYIRNNLSYVAIVKDVSGKESNIDIPTADSVMSDKLGISYANIVYRPSLSLVNTSWVFNNQLNENVNNFTYLIDFTSNNSIYNSIEWRNSNDKLLYNSTLTYFNLEGGWQNESYKTITITGGYDVANPDLVNWLQSNATLQ